MHFQIEYSSLSPPVRASKKRAFIRLRSLAQTRHMSFADTPIIRGLMPRRGISQAEPPTGPQNESYIRDSAFLWFGGFCVAPFVLASFVAWCAVRLVGPLFCVLSSPSLGARFLFLSVRASDRMRTFNGSCVSLSHFRPAFASRTSVSAKVVVNAGFVEKHTLPTHTHHCSLCPLQAKRPAPSRTSPRTPSLRSSFLWS